MQYVYFSLRQTEHNDQYSSDNVYNNLIFPQKSSDCAGQQSERAEYDGKAKHKTKRSQKNFMLFYPILLQNMRYTVAKAAAYRGKWRK